MKTTNLFALLMAITILFACNKFKDITPDYAEGPKPEKKYFKGISNQVILDWNIAAFDAMGGATYQHSLLASRVNAMVHIAMHDALNAIGPAFETYALQTKDYQAEPISAAASAAHRVLVAHFPDKKADLDARLQQSLAGIPEGQPKAHGLALGVEAANAILALRQNDGAFADPFGAIEPSTEPGVYQAVPPFDIIFAPFWKTMQPFGLQSPEQFRSTPQPSLTSEVYTQDYNEIKSVGQLNSQTRTAEQTSYAKFWYEFSEAGWNRVARSAISGKKLDLLTTARLFALLNMALADSYTAGWDSKFHYNFWRPYTAIRAAENDGNGQTVADQSWEPLMPTPPVQDYPSTHSALGNAGATVLAAILGDNTKFTMISNTAEIPGSTRSFKSFSQAADENADSRVMAGIHFRFSCEAGQDLGNKVGKFIVENKLRPVKTSQQ
ncbi:phosphatase PAP2 family protein [Rhodocytophaga aerolata]|uniref:Phosphatase PAP2 family protein n=1 Tax=Rhodocytophaga aerolata TaxID=455078 RepID=A0ABT8R801_9BACT|nr:vanadium-dependent haloperoxidase [Rhodocytophaga aerolata]MDO1448231.1 phosphatase PAP2 family protein [Rhodocytophaga aerolata]